MEIFPCQIELAVINLALCTHGDELSQRVIAYGINNAVSHEAPLTSHRQQGPNELGTSCGYDRVRSTTSGAASSTVNAISCIVVTCFVAIPIIRH
ncbi:hypothetical protein MESS2_1030175 [Mesorhizobium metallidurans STM 2683]|uniref:Uncharacterized protein n=1 Tax=Mesorhizobium metallidurans STM 2683 TaxID=1297569 RepID=M5EGQ9_9HYPH|nr:hypothetical protein MESS2_1030175 [Mesorhizobium metallidurans STM 2683]